MTPNVTLKKAKEDLESVLDQVDRDIGVWIKRGHNLYHLHRELLEDEVLKGLRASQAEAKDGKARVLRSLFDLD